MHVHVYIHVHVFLHKLCFAACAIVLESGKRHTLDHYKFIPQNVKQHDMMLKIDMPVTETQNYKYIELNL